MKKFLAIAFTLLLVIGCNGSSQAKSAKKFEAILAQKYGATFRVVKAYTLHNGFSVFQNMSTGEYVAYNISKFDSKVDNYASYIKKTSSGDRVGGLGPYDQWETELQSKEVTGQRWEDVEVYDTLLGEYVTESQYVSYTYTEYYYEDVLRTYYTDGSITFQVGQNTGKDLEKIGGLARENDIGKLGDFITKNYGLAEERGLEVAKLVSSWNQISQTRSMTDADKKAFSTEVLGTDMATFEKAYQASKKGNNSDKLKKLVEKASKVNNITPEHFMNIMNDML